MKLIVLDYLRRWGWFYLLGFILATALDIAAAFAPSLGVFGPYFLAPYLGPVFVLGFDLMRGAAGVTIALPISTRKVGLGYWIVGVCVPPVLLSLAHIFAAIVVRPFNPPIMPGWDQVALTFVISTLISGCIFFVLTFLPGGPQEGLRDNIVAALAGASWGLGAFSSVGLKLLLDFRKPDPVTIATFVFAALLLTLLGFLRCGEVVRLRARNRIARQRPVGQSAIEADVTGLSDRGISGFPLLFFDSIKFSLAIAAVLMLFAVLLRSFTRFFMHVDSLFIQYILLLCGLLPNLRYLPGLRQMRALPISLDTLVFTLFLLPLVNFSLCLGLILVVQAITAPGTLNTTPATFLFTAAIASLGNSMIVRFGPKALAIGFSTSIALLFALPMEFFKGVPVAAWYALSTALMVASFVILRASLQSSKIYRLPPVPFAVG